MSKMRVRAVTLPALLWIVAAQPLPAQAGTQTTTTDVLCEVSVHVTEQAEKRMGGALYEGPMESAEAMPETMAAMPEMAGAHEVHTGQQGGAFFMAPNKIHHLEAKYTKECGVQLLVYNAFTEPIGVQRFQAFVKIIPEDDSEWDKEVIRFLTPTADGGILRARGDHEIGGPFKIELYVKFPESDDAEMFNIPLDDTAH